jgi:hypothetical protein
MITTPFGMKGCLENNTERVSVMHEKMPRVEIMYDILVSPEQALHWLRVS